MIRLKPDTILEISYLDKTTFGSPVGTKPDETARRAFAPLMARMAQQGVRIRDYIQRADVLDEIRAGWLFRAITLPAADGSWRVREEALYPALAEARPFSLTAKASGAEVGTCVRLPPSHWPDAHAAISALYGAGLGESEMAAMHPDIQCVVKGFLDRGLATIEDRSWIEKYRPLERSDLTFVGHNAVVIRDGPTTIILDPFMRATSRDYPDGYQPLQVSQLGRLDAVLLTHSHPDHFDPASLLRIPATTAIYVPAVERESLLTVDLAYRLRELGFTNVHVLAWNDVTKIGEIEIRALPFYGEQPTDSHWVHSEVRNQGCTYLIKTSTWSGTFLADSGTDHAGNVKDMASEYRKKWGPVDMVFCGYRGWMTYAAQLLGSSVARYMLFIPPEFWGIRMHLMSTIDDALDVAERWGARYLCPYGDGGAPWYWNIGLGPRLDGTGTENAQFDPFPERVVAAAAARSLTVDGQHVHSPTEVLLLRPGDSLDHISAATGPTCLRHPGHAWCFGNRDGTLTMDAYSRHGSHALSNLANERSLSLKTAK